MGEDNDTWWCEHDGVTPPTLIPLNRLLPLCCFWWWCVVLPAEDNGRRAGDDDEWWLKVSGDTITAVGEAGDGSNGSPPPNRLLHALLPPLILFRGIDGQL